MSVIGNCVKCKSRKTITDIRKFFLCEEHYRKLVPHIKKLLNNALPFFIWAKHYLSYKDYTLLCRIFRKVVREIYQEGGD